MRKQAFMGGSFLESDVVHRRRSHDTGRFDEFQLAATGFGSREGQVGSVAILSSLRLTLT
jgi:hypothetical protein